MSAFLPSWLSARVPVAALPKGVLAQMVRTVEVVPLPDAVLRRAIAAFVGMQPRPLEGSEAIDRAFVAEMAADSIANFTNAANAQHYEVPAEFFALVLGRNRKYSCCFFETGQESLDAAEDAALAITMDRAGVADGQRILELGCGWGSLTLAMAARYPGASITAVSNSHSQRRYIEGQALLRGLINVQVVTADMNVFEPEGLFDRVVSVEMFEHMSNWPALLARVRKAIAPDGRMFVHVFAHPATPYRFDHTDKTDWIGQHFFTGGIMPSDGLMRVASPDFAVEQEWRWSGHHYALTAEHWLANFDRNAGAISHIMADVYKGDAKLWTRRWRLFFLATEGLFGLASGNIWGVKHYLLRPL